VFGGVSLDDVGIIVGARALTIDGDVVATLGVLATAEGATVLVELEKVGDTKEDGCAVKGLGAFEADGNCDDAGNAGFM
jgi:hypothetical protein